MSRQESDKIVIGVVGNPNCGKTTLFNALTGAKQQVGNWPGVTVERKVGHYRHASRVIELVDLPGTYSLETGGDQTSLDETIARDYVLAQEADAILNILDASNLERNLYLTVQLLEMRVPMLVALNMIDLARDQGIHIDVEALAQRLGCPVVAISAASGEGVEELKNLIDQAAIRHPLPGVQVPYSADIEAALAALGPAVRAAVGDRKVDAEHLARIEFGSDAQADLLPAQSTRDKHIHPRWLALKLLEEDPLARKLLHQAPDTLQAVAEHKRRIEDAAGEETDILVADCRYNFINQAIDGVVRRTAQVREAVSEQIDRFVLNRALGIPIFLAVMYLMFLFTINLGGAFIDFFDAAANTIFVEGSRVLLTGLGSPDMLTVLLADGVGGGIQVVASFIPIIGFMYLFLALLESSGYMARAAFVMDRFMQVVGLPGKSFVPLIVGFGCNVPAILATRTLESRRDRMLTVLMNPFMSCGARLPVYVVFAAAFFPSGGQNLVFALYLTGIAFAVLTGFILKHTLLKGDSSPFVMELPPYHVPRLKNVLAHTWERLKGFIFGAGQVIVPMVMVIHFLTAWSTDGSFGKDTNPDQSVLSEVGRSLTPAFAPMGIAQDNWPATVGIFTGVMAKEVIVATLDSIYSQLGEEGAAQPAQAEEDFSLWRGLAGALATVPANLAKLADALLDPLGLKVAGESQQGIADEFSLKDGTFGAMAARFDGQIGAFAYLLFILMYFPCAASTAAIYRETGLGWALFVGFWTTFMAYLAATLFYQIASFAAHPAHSLTWIGVMLGLFAALILLLRQLGQRHHAPPGVGAEKWETP